MERADRDQQERAEQRAGIAWALADLDGLRARGVIDQHSHALLRRDYEVRLQGLQAAVLPIVGVARTAYADPDRPPPAPAASGQQLGTPIGVSGPVPHPELPGVVPPPGAVVAVGGPQETQPAAQRAQVARPPADVTGLWINLLLFVGAFFVVIAALIFVASQWASIGAVAKASLMIGFTLAFIVGGLVCVRLPRVRPAGHTFLAIGAILLPLDIVGGYNVLFRAQGFSPQMIWAWGSLICALFYGALALRGLGRPYAAAMLLATISAWCGLLAVLDVPRPWLAAAFVPLPLLLLAIGRLVERTATLRALLGPLPTWAAQLLIPVAWLLVLLRPFERAEAPGALVALALIALFYVGAALSQSAPTLRALHSAGAWLAVVVLAPTLGWWADSPPRGYAAIALGVAWLALAVGVGLRRAGANWRNAANVAFVVGWAHIAVLLIPWGFLIDDMPGYWTGIFGGALLYVALCLWGFREPLLLYPLALAGTLTLFHLLAIGPKPDAYGYAWAYMLVALMLFALLQPLRLAGVARAWDRHLVIIGQIIAIGAALTAQQVGDPFQSAAVPLVALLASGMVVAIERRPELLILPNLWGLAAAATVVRLAGSGPRWAPASYAAVGLLLAIGLQGWRNIPAARRDGWYIAHRLSAGGWAALGPLLACVSLAAPLSEFLGTGQLLTLVLDHGYGPAGLAVALCGAALAADAVMTLRRPTGYSASGMIALATLMGIARITPNNPQAYAVPLGLYFLALSVYVAYERDLGPARMPAANALLSSAIVVMLGTTFLQSLVQPWRYTLLGLVEGLVLLGITAFLRRRYGVALALGFLTLIACRAVFDVARALPNWATIGVLGLTLLGLGVLVLLRRDRLEAWGGSALRRWSQLT